MRLGLADSFTVNYYNLLVAGAEARKIQAEQQYRDTLRSFLATVNLDEDLSLDGKVILAHAMPNIDETVILKNAYDRRADYRSAKLNLENARLSLDIYSNEALPSLTAELSASTLGQDSSAGTAYKDMGKFSYPNIEARMKLTYPIGNKEQEINERNARFKLKQAQINYKKVHRHVKDDVKSKTEAIQTAYEVYQKSHIARKEAEAYYYKMLRSLRRGRLDSATVKNGLDAMVSSRQDELGSLVSFNLSLLQLEVAQNRLWEHYNINVDDYIPKDKK